MKAVLFFVLVSTVSNTINWLRLMPDMNNLVKGLICLGIISAAGCTAQTPASNATSYSGGDTLTGCDGNCNLDLHSHVHPRLLLRLP